MRAGLFRRRLAPPPRSAKARFDATVQVDRHPSLLESSGMNIDQIVADLRTERERIHSAITALEGSEGSYGNDRRRGRAGGPRRMSAATRARMAASQRARWAKRKKPA